MGAQLGLPDALRRRGLTVEVVPGWETRSAGSFNPVGAVSHWTAGPAGTTKRPSLSICTYGRADLPGPLCNVYLDRYGVAVVVAAGRANHAGAGTWGGATGNSSFFGTEAEAAGPDDFTAEQRVAYPRVNAAFCDLGRFGADMVCGHSEYATPRGRKTDVNNYPMTTMRAQVAALLANTPEDDMGYVDDLSVDALKKIRAFVWEDKLTDGVTVPISVMVDIQKALRDPIRSQVPGSDAVFGLRDLLAVVDANLYAAAKQVGAIAQRPAVDFDEQAFAQALAPLLPATTPAVLARLSDADVQRLAKAAADEADSRERARLGS